MKQQQQKHPSHRAVSAIRNGGSLIPVGERYSLKNYPCMEE
jgi:hypothetical protein